MNDYRILPVETELLIFRAARKRAIELGLSDVAADVAAVAADVDVAADVAADVAGRNAVERARLGHTPDDPKVNALFTEGV